MSGPPHWRVGPWPVDADLIAAAARRAAIERARHDGFCRLAFCGLGFEPSREWLRPKYGCRLTAPDFARLYRKRPRWGLKSPDRGATHSTTSPRRSSNPTTVSLSPVCIVVLSRPARFCWTKYLSRNIAMTLMFDNGSIRSETSIAMPVPVRVIGFGTAGCRCCRDRNRCIGDDRTPCHQSGRHAGH